MALWENKPAPSERFAPKAEEGNKLHPLPPMSVKVAEVTHDTLHNVENCPACEVVFDIKNRQEMLRAMVIGDVLNAPRFKYPFGRRR